VDQGLDRAAIFPYVDVRWGSGSRWTRHDSLMGCLWLEEGGTINDPRTSQLPVQVATFVKRGAATAARRICRLWQRFSERELWRTQAQFAGATMIPPDAYVDNLRLAQRVAGISGAVVECGVWRGGMAAGIAKTLGPGRDYVLFDSFEGLPPAREIDGQAAIAWQRDTTSPEYFDNCRAEMSAAWSAMRAAGISEPDLRKGWFEETVPLFAATETPIALLRLDGDWYDSTLVCLQNLFPLVVESGIVIIDDYGTWDGCTKAVHAYLAENSRPEAIRHSAEGVAFLGKAVAEPTQPPAR
jgi:O-methyltransferase